MSKNTKIKRLTYTIDEAAKILETSQREIFQQIQDKTLPAFRMGKALQIPVGGVIKLLEQKEVECGNY